MWTSCERVVMFVRTCLNRGSAQRFPARPLEAIEVEHHDLAARESDDLLVGEETERPLDLLADRPEASRNGLDGERADDRERLLAARAASTRVGEEKCREAFR